MEYFRNMKCEALPCSSWEQNFWLYGGQNFAQTLQQNKKAQPAEYFGVAVTCFRKNYKA